MLNTISFNKIFLSLVYFCIFINADATTYYINSRIGDDNNIGTTKESVWKTLKNLEQNIFKPGDSILFAKGSIYTGGFTFTSSGTTEKPIVFSNYSVGADVILSTDRTKLSPIFVRYGAGRNTIIHKPGLGCFEWKYFSNTRKLYHY